MTPDPQETEDARMEKRALEILGRYDDGGGFGMFLADLRSVEREALERAAKIAHAPYGEPVGAALDDGPGEVGRKVAAAIRREAGE